MVGPVGLRASDRDPILELIRHRRTHRRIPLPEHEAPVARLELVALIVAEQHPDRRRAQHGAGLDPRPEDRCLVRELLHGRAVPAAEIAGVDGDRTAGHLGDPHGRTHGIRSAWEHGDRRAVARRRRVDDVAAGRDHDRRFGRRSATPARRVEQHCGDGAVREIHLGGLAQAGRELGGGPGSTVRVPGEPAANHLLESPVARGVERGRPIDADLRDQTGEEEGGRGRQGVHVGGRLERLPRQQLRR